MIFIHGGLKICLDSILLFCDLTIDFDYWSSVHFLCQKVNFDNGI